MSYDHNQHCYIIAIPLLSGEAHAEIMKRGGKLSHIICIQLKGHAKMSHYIGQHYLQEHVLSYDILFIK